MKQFTTKILKFYEYIITNKLIETKSKLKKDKLFSIIRHLSNRNFLTGNEWHPIAIKNLNSNKQTNGWLLKTFGLNNNNYKAYLDFLKIDVQLIEIYDEFSITQHFAKQARLRIIDIELDINDIEMVDVQVTPEYEKYLKENIDKRTIVKDKNLNALYNLYKSGRITILYDKANKFVDEWCLTGQLDIKLNKITKISVEKAAIYKTMILDVYKCADKINDSFFIVRGENNDRVYHTLSNLKRELRQFIRIDGFKLVEIDMKNSQPFLLSEIVRKESKNNDVLFFNSLCIDGKIYEYFMNKMSGNRNTIKKAFLSYMFAPLKEEDKKTKRDITKSTSFKEMNNIFRTEFPSIYAFILNIKYEKNYNELALLLQRLEAKLFSFDVDELIQKGSYPCFDSLYVKESLSNQTINQIIINSKQQNIIINKQQLSINK